MYKLLIALLLVVTFPSSVSSVENFARRGALTGPSVQSSVLSNGAKIFTVKVDTDVYDVRVLTPLVKFGRQTGIISPERAARGLYLQDYMKNYGAVAVIAGGYIDRYSPPTPLGLVKSDGLIVSSFHESWLTEALFCSNQGRAFIKIVDKVNIQSFRDCLQAGPALLLNGNIPSETQARNSGYRKLASSNQEQTFVCINRDEQVVLGVTEKADLPTLTNALRRPEINCVDAMRLTGSDTSGMRSGVNLYGDDDYLFPSALGIIARY